ncbi:signal peptidase I [Niveispirillum irakense]|uniref:signal peptidase I n=1 Tax=Niveispirillum irakense TaxID=34011 RepID=UPI00040F5DF7|nr:signal peptidase I [Niveispirillum irakense]
MKSPSRSKTKAKIKPVRLPAASTGGGWETARTILIALLLAIGVRTTGFEMFNIPTGSMVPTLLVGDYLFVSKFSYGFSRYSLPGFLQFGDKAPPVTKDCQAVPGRLLARMPERGDVAVFKLPKDTSIDYIKRIVGLPCDRIQMIGGTLYINGDAVPRMRVPDYVVVETFGGTFTAPQYIETLPNGRQHPVIEMLGDDHPLDNTPVYTVPPGYVFAMGDSRDNSQDSRVEDAVGMVPLENMVGRATYVLLSLDEGASIWQFWKWPSVLRTDRLWEAIE